MRRGNARMAIESIGRLIDAIETLERTPRAVAVIAAPLINAELRQQFLRGTDPYGREWRALKPSTLAKGRRPPPLTDSTKLRDGTTAKANTGGRAGIRIRVGKEYGFFHQVGFRVGKMYVAPRRILPQFGLPYAWRRILVEAARQAAKGAK